MSEQTQQVDSIGDFAKSPDGALSRWKSELELAKKEFDRYWKRCDDITRRYRMETESGEAREDEALCLLWAQVATEIPAIYQRRPQPQVSRRFKAKAVSARVASLIAERYLAVDIDRDGIDGEAEAMVRSYLLYGRAVAWVDIEPQFAGERTVDLRAPVRYVAPRDFLHSPSRTWHEVTWVAKRHFFTRDKAVRLFADGMKRFGWAQEDFGLDTEPQYGSEEMKRSAGDVFKRGTVWEVWDEPSGMILFVHLGMKVLVDVRAMPTKLESRFPAPEPCFGTLSDGSLIPVPDFVQWQQLSDEIDELSTRIKYLTEACRLVGVYDESVPELGKILTSTTENDLVGVKNYRTMAEKGGLKGAVEFLPVEQIAATIQILSEQRQHRIDMLNQLSGHTDVMRGQSDPRTTATAERIKSNYGSLRLQEKQSDFQRFMDRLLRVKAEIICELAPAEVLVSVSSADELPEVQQAQLQAQQAQEQAMQQGMPPPPAPDVLGEAVKLLKDEKLRDFRLEVQERSMAALDEAEERTAAQEFTASIGDLVAKAAGAPPELLDFVGESALFVARRHRVGRDMEATLEAALANMKKKAEAARAQPPQPPPQVQAEQMRHQNTMKEGEQKHSLELQRIDKEAERTERLESAEARSQQAIAMFKANVEKEMAQNEAQWSAWLKEREMQFDMQLAERKAQLDERIALMEARMEQAAMSMKAENDRYATETKAREASRRKSRKVRVDGEEFKFEVVEDGPEEQTLQ